MSSARSTSTEMSAEEEAEFNADVADPSRITTQARCMEIVTTLEGEIAGIESQLEIARVRAAVQPLDDRREDWLRRAAAALSFKRSERWRVLQRSRELRGFKGPSQTPPKHTKEEKAAKEVTLRAQADARKAKKLAEASANQVRALELARASSWRKHFVDVAKNRLEEDLYEAMVYEAKRRAHVPVD